MCAHAAEEMSVRCFLCFASVCMCVKRLLFFVFLLRTEQKGRLVSESVLEQDSPHNSLMISSAERISPKAVM